MKPESALMLMAALYGGTALYTNSDAALIASSIFIAASFICIKMSGIGRRK